MICYAAQYNQLKPDRGNSGAIPSCVTILSGFFVEAGYEPETITITIK